MRFAFLLALAVLPAAQASEAPRVVEAVRPRPAGPSLPASARPPMPRPAADTAEIRRLRADLGGRVTARVKAEAARIRAANKGASVSAALARYAAGLRREERELRRDRAHAFQAMMAAPKGSAQRAAWWTAVQVDNVMLDDYAEAFAALNAVPAR